MHTFTHLGEKAVDLVALSGWSLSQGSLLGRSSRPKRTLHASLCHYGGCPRYDASESQNCCLQSFMCFSMQQLYLGSFLWRDWTTLHLLCPHIRLVAGWAVSHIACLTKCTFTSAKRQRNKPLWVLRRVELGVGLDQRWLESSRKLLFAPTDTLAFFR